MIKYALIPQQNWFACGGFHEDHTTKNNNLRIRSEIDS